MDLVEHNGFPVLVLNVIEDDGSKLDTAALGSIVARMHQLPLPEVDFVA
ncbi:hypothetical protein [Paenarthrobacter sp. NPDC018779]